MQGLLKKGFNTIRTYFPNLLSVKLLCVGSPVTDSCKIGVCNDYPFDSDMLVALNTTLKNIADREKIILIYPTGYQKSWNDGRPTTANQLGINDVNFFREMCNYAVANLSVDATKIAAKYIDGVLQISLPLIPGKEEVQQRIVVE